MADARKIGVAQIDRLYDFLGGLQASGYKIDPRQYMVLNDLLLVLAARGELSEDVSLKTLIAPVVCSSAAEQQDFYQRFDRWYPTLFPAEQARSSGEKIRLPSQPKRKWARPLLNQMNLIWILTMIIVIVLLAWLISNLTALGSQLNSSLLFYGAIVAFVGLLGWLSRQLWILHQENQYITRELANQEPVYTQVPLRAYVQEIMPVTQFKPIVSTLRRRTQIPSTEVDIDRTIQTALDHNNWVEIIYRQRQLMPEYLVLVDRKSRFDQQARFVLDVLAKLAADGVWLHQYEFSGDPRICFALDKKDVPLQLKDLQSRHPEARLLVFSDTGELINPLTGHLQDWLEPLLRWEERAILIPDKLHQVLLEELQARDFAVLPLSFNGLAALVRAFETDKFSFLSNSLGTPLSQLVTRPMRWTGRDAPPKAEIDALLDDLKQYLGSHGFYLVAATAVYPELHWELTLFLGGALQDEYRQALLNSDGLVRLVHLPWFRLGYMPDWFRLAVIERLTLEQENKIRVVLAELLATAFEGKDFHLEFASKMPKSLSARTRRLLHTLIRNSSSDSMYHDHIFAKFILKRHRRKLAVSLPAQLRKFSQAIRSPNADQLAEFWQRTRKAFGRLLSVGVWTDSRPAYQIAWQERLLDAVAQLGEEGRMAVDFLRARKIKIKFRTVRPSTGAYWSIFGNIYLNSRYYSYETPLDDVRLKTLIIYNARCLQQGMMNALSIHGVLDAWQLEFYIYHRVRGRYPHYAIEELMSLPLIYDRSVLKKAITLMQTYAGKDYNVDLLPLFPLGMETRYLLSNRTTLPSKYEAYLAAMYRANLDITPEQLKEICYKYLYVDLDSLTVDEISITISRLINFQKKYSNNGKLRELLQLISQAISKLLLARIHKFASRPNLVQFDLKMNEARELFRQIEHARVQIDLMDTWNRFEQSQAETLLENWIEAGEGERLEFESSLRYNLKADRLDKEIEREIARTVCGFMNTEGGTLIIGLDDDGNILGLDKDFSTLGRRKNKDGFVQAFVNVMENLFVASVSPIFYTARFEEYQDKLMYVVDVKKSEKPIFCLFDGVNEFYIRDQSTTRKLDAKATVEYFSDHFKN